MFVCWFGFFSGSSCVCQPGYRTVSSSGGSSVVCEKCPENMVSIKLLILCHNDNAVIILNFLLTASYFYDLKLLCTLVFASEF